MTTERKTLTISQMIGILSQDLEQYGDLPIFFTDTISRSGVNCYTESAANFDSPKAILIRSFNLDSGINN